MGITLDDGLIEGWTKLGLFVLILIGFLGWIFLMIKLTKRREKSANRKRHSYGMNREQRRAERAMKRRKRQR
jgi:hypothetical protein